MSLRTINYDRSVNCSAKVRSTYDPVIHTLKDGSTVVSFREIDYPSVLRSRGKVDDWSISHLVASGIDPMSIRVETGYNSRAEGIQYLDEALADVDLLFNPKSDPSDTKTE